MPPKPFICRRAKCVLRMAGKSGIVDADNIRPPSSHSAIRNAFAQCRSMRRASVFTPAQGEEAVEGPAYAAHRVLQEP